MKLAIQKHLRDFLAILALVVLAAGIGGYILANQRLRFPLIEKKPFTIKAVLANAQAVQPGQGQTVRTAGVEIGQIGKVTLENGRAVVDLQLEPKYKGYVRRDATALLRSRTGLQDMFLEVDPGRGRPLPENGRIPVSNTAPQTNPDEILSVLDSDTRNYLKLLISGAGKGLKGRGTNLQETNARLGPLNSDLARVTRAVAQRKRNLENLVNKYGRLTAELGSKDRDIVRLVSAANSTFSALASQDANISEAVGRLPGALRTTQQTLAKVDTLGGRLGPALEALRPPFRRLASTNRAVLPFVKEATPQIRDQLRPFARNAQPFTRDLGSAAVNLNRAAPDLTSSFGELNRFFNIGAFNPGGAEGLQGTPAQQAARQEGYLYWLAWQVQNTTSIFSTADGQGVFRRIAVGGVGCGVIGQLLGNSPTPLSPSNPAQQAANLLGTTLKLCVP